MKSESNTEIGWDFIPPERHFQSPKELKEMLNLYLTVGLEKWEYAPGIKPPEEKFEIVRHSMKSGEKLYLWPTALTHAYLFRGQEQFYDRCVPSLFRKDRQTATDLFINQIRIEEFKLMLQQYPQVKYFEDNGIVVDYKGLAQHYGIETDVLDLTSSLEVALFFAMCSYDSETHGYSPKTDNDLQYIGYLYAYPYFFHMMSDQKPPQEMKLMPIGLQPFKRPGLQRGFSLHFSSEEQFVAPLYSFSYTAKDSQDIFSKLNHIFVDDELAIATREISESKILSIEALTITCARHSYNILGRRLSYGTACKLLQNNNISLTAHPQWLLSPTKKKEIFNHFKNEEFDEFRKYLVQRKTISDGMVYPFIDFQTICKTELLTLFKKGCPSLNGYNSGVALVNAENDKYVALEFDSSRPQTIPNKETKQIDKWDDLQWAEYKLPNRENRFSGVFPIRRLVKVPGK